MTATAELQRLKYLSAMGVPVYLARRPLPGAAVSRLRYRVDVSRLQGQQGSPHADGQDPGPAVSQSGEPVVAPAQPARRGGAVELPKELRESLRDSTPVRGTARGSTRATADSLPESSDSALAAASAGYPEIQEPFRIAVVVCADRLWLEDLGDQALALDQLRLITAMGRALVHPEPLAVEPRTAQFDWPVHANQQLDLSAAEASASLRGFLLRQIEEGSLLELMCLGDEVTQRVRDLPLPCARRSVCSTRQMLENPALKPGVWKELSAC